MAWCVVDLDRTLIEDRTVTRLAERLGRDVEAVLGRHGEPNAGVAESQRVMACFAGIDATGFSEICAAFKLRPGAKEALEAVRRSGFDVMIASASYEAAAQAAADAVGARRVVALRPEVERGVLTGRLHPSPWEGPCGRSICKGRVVATLERPVVAIGDGSNDVCMFEEADLGIAMRPCHPDAAAAADVAVDGWDEVAVLVRGLVAGERLDIA